MQSCKNPELVQEETAVDAASLAESGVRAIPPEAREVLKALRALEAKRPKPNTPIKLESQVKVEPPITPIEQPQSCPVRTVRYEVCPKMLAAHMTLVHQVVAPIARRVPANVQRDDLLAAGVFGLADSLRKNGGDGGTTFEWYARTRIRGAVLDELRAQDWLKRRARDAVNAANEGEAETVLFVGFDELTTIEEEEYLASVETNPAAAYETKEIGQLLARALDKLPERERQVIGMYYFEDAKYKDIGAKLGVSEPRVFQLHARALGRLKESFRPKRSYRNVLQEVRRNGVEPASSTDSPDDWLDVVSMNNPSSDVA